MSMYKFGIRASKYQDKNREIISFIESLGYENKLELTGCLIDPPSDTVYAAGFDCDSKIHCTADKYCSVVYDSLERAKEYLYVPSKQITITVPEGYEIDKENSTFECIKFKKKQLTYEDIAKRLFKDKGCFFTGVSGEVHYIANLGVGYFQSNNCISKKQAEKFLAINKLMNVAKYLNDGWQPNWNDSKEYRFYIKQIDDKLFIDFAIFNGYSVYFKTRELAKQAIEILGEETIKLALCTDY